MTHTLYIFIVTRAVVLSLAATAFAVAGAHESCKKPSAMTRATAVVARADSGALCPRGGLLEAQSHGGTRLVEASITRPRPASKPRNAICLVLGCPRS